MKTCRAEDDPAATSHKVFRSTPAGLLHQLWSRGSPQNEALLTAAPTTPGDARDGSVPDAPTPWPDATFAIPNQQRIWVSGDLTLDVRPWEFTKRPREFPKTTRLTSRRTVAPNRVSRVLSLGRSWSLLGLNPRPAHQRLGLKNLASVVWRSSRARGLRPGTSLGPVQASLRQAPQVPILIAADTQVSAGVVVGRSRRTPHTDGAREPPPRCPHEMTTCKYGLTTWNAGGG